MVDDKGAVRRALAEAGVAPLPGPFLDFLDPWGNRIEIVSHKAGFSVRIVSRHPDRGHRLFGLADPQLCSVEGNIHDERSIANAVAGAYGVVNAVSLYVEHGSETFHSVHVEAAQQLADHASRAGAERLAPQELAPTPARHRSIFVNVAKPKWRFGPRSQMRFSFARR